MYEYICKSLDYVASSNSQNIPNPAYIELVKGTAHDVDMPTETNPMKSWTSTRYCIFLQMWLVHVMPCNHLASLLLVCFGLYFQPK